MLNIRQITETCLYSTNLEAMKDFYHHRLGLEMINYTPGSHLFLRAGTSVLLIFNPDETRKQGSLPPHYGSGQLHFAFEVAHKDYPASKEFVQQLGIEIEHEHHWGKLRSFYFRDPDQNCVEILEGNIWT